jgi:hypothetical protein
MKPLYSGLQYLSYENLGNGKTHPIFKVNCHSPVDIARLPVKLKLLPGSYILQSKRIKMYKSETDPKGKQKMNWNPSTSNTNRRLQE